MAGGPALAGPRRMPLDRNSIPLPRRRCQPGGLHLKTCGSVVVFSQGFALAAPVLAQATCQPAAW